MQGRSDAARPPTRLRNAQLVGSWSACAPPPLLVSAFGSGALLQSSQAMRARSQTSWICSLAAIACITCGAFIGCDTGVETGVEVVVVEVVEEEEVERGAGGKSGKAEGRGSAEASRPVPLAKPNIVIIVTDDQATSTLAHMPHTQALLVREGTLFPNFFISWSRLRLLRTTRSSGRAELTTAM